MITIAHLYFDLLNLYGESGNVLALKNNFESLGIKVNLCNVSLGDKFDFNKYDIVYIGSGTENNLNLVIPHLFSYKDEIKKYIDGGNLFIATGNSLNLFGKDLDNIECLSIFDFSVKTLSKRFIEEGIYTFNKFKLIGFLNIATTLSNGNYLVKSKVIESNNSFDIPFIKHNNFYGTYLIGPLLIKNPKLNKYIINNFIKNNNFKIKNKLDLSLDLKAYKKYLENHE